MHQYGVRDVEKLLGLSRSTVRALITAGFVTPTRGPRNAWLFSFRDLIVLRTAQALVAAHIPQRRILKSLKELRRHLPESMPLSGLRIAAVADHVVVSEGTTRWLADSGQYVLGFDGDPVQGSLSVIAPPTPAAIPVQPERSGDSSIHEDDTEAAMRAYERDIAESPARIGARIDLGRLLHENGRLVKAEKVYRDALKACGNDPLLLYNFGVLLDDMDRKPEAMAAYELALRGDPEMADCHYNLALLCEALERPKDAIRHMSQYRRLTGARRD
ncbi:MAG: tetratricopeptide repeat protein [Rhodanobacteraceae bacterium]